MATIEQAVTSESMQESDGHAMNDAIGEVANQPPMKLSIRYSVNQIEVLQTLGDLLSLPNRNSYRN